MYRAYPAPSQNLPSGNNGNGTKKTQPYGNASNNARPPAAMPGSIGIGARPKFGSPSLPPPSKKHRAIPIGKANMPTSLVDEKIAQRRAQLRNLKAQSANSNASNILARARAVTSSNTRPSAPPPITHGNSATSAGSYLNNEKPNYATRSRPIAVPKSPNKNSSRFVPLNLGSKIPAGTGSKISVSAPPSRPSQNGKTGIGPPRVISAVPDQNGYGVVGNQNVAETTSSPPAPVSSSNSIPSISTNGITPHPTPNLTVQIPTPATAKLVGQLLQPKNVETATSVSANPSNQPAAPRPDTSLLQKTSTTSKAIPTMNEEKKYDMPSTEPITKDTQAELKLNPSNVENATSSALGSSSLSAPPVITQQQQSQPQEISKHPAAIEPNNVPDLEPEVTKTSSKRLTLSALRDAANSPPKISEAMGTTVIAEAGESEESKTSSTMRLVKELRKAKDEKIEAMKRMAKLESEVMELRLNHTKEVQEQRQRRMKDRESPRRRRIKSPEPSSRSRPDANPLLDEKIANLAVETVEDVFTSNSATYVVRKPYGGSKSMEYTFLDEDDVHAKNKGCPISWSESIESYSQNSTATKEKTLEVVSKLEADGSILLIFGDSCRHGIPMIGVEGITGYEFRTFDDVEYLEGSLGKIVFVDSEGNDGEYWLDPVYEEAQKIRETYCSNLFSAALALKASSPHAGNNTTDLNEFNLHTQTPTQTTEAVMLENSASSPKPPAVDACVGTEDLPQPQLPPQKPKINGKSSDEGKPKQKMHSADTQKQPAPQHEDSGSTDVLSIFILTFFSMIFSIIWFILMIPVRVTRITFSVALIFGIVNICWLYFVDNEAAIDMGAIIDKQYNIN